MNNDSFLIHEIKGYLASTFVAEYHNKILILDGGSRLDAVRIKRFVEDILKRPFTDVKLIISTHPHPDHAGGAPLLRKKFKTPIATHENFDMWYRGVRGWIQHKIDTALAHYSAKKMKGGNERTWYPRKLNAEFKLKNHEPIPFFEDWETLFIPGHTMYDIALYNKDKKILAIGDIVIALKGHYYLPIPVSFKEKMEESLLKLNGIDANTILMAHGGILENPKENFFKNMIKKIDYPNVRILKPLDFLCSFAPDVHQYKKNQNKLESKSTDTLDK